MDDWPHAPAHRLEEGGAYMVTAGTYHKRPLLCSDKKLRLVHDALLKLARRYEWFLQAWAVLPNHYHFVGIPSGDPRNLSEYMRHLHSDTSRRLNELDECEGRRVWFQFWDSRITYNRSFLARLKYVHYNPVRHGLAEDPVEYQWCSAKWFATTPRPAFRRTVEDLKVDRVNVKDDF